MNTQNAIINFVYFTANFPHDFIEKCWQDNTWLINHLKTKLRLHATDDFVSKDDFLSFFMELDRENQVKLINWITENYLAFKNLKNT